MASKILAKELLYLYSILLKNNHLDWIIKEPEKKLPLLVINWSGLKKNILISASYVPSLNKEFRRVFNHTNIQVILKCANALNSILAHPKDKTPLHFKQLIVCKLSCPKDCCSESYISELSRCIENRVKEHSSHISSAVNIDSESKNFHCAKIFHFKVTDQDSKQVAREARKAIHIRINNLALNHNTGKMCIPEILISLLGADRPLDGSVQTAYLGLLTRSHTSYRSKKQVFQSPTSLCLKFNLAIRGCFALPGSVV